MMQGPSLLHGLLSPSTSSFCSTSSSVTLKEGEGSSSTLSEPAKKPKKPVKKRKVPDQDAGGNPVEKEKPKRKRPPKKPKKDLEAAATTAGQFGTTKEKTGSTVLAGGATATPVSVPLTPSVETLRDYVLHHQHKQAMQQHLQQLQTQNQLTFPAANITATGQSQLYRLLSPPTSSASSLVNSCLPSSSGFLPSFPVTLGSLVRPESRPGVKDLIGTAVAAAPRSSGGPGTFPIVPTEMKSVDTTKAYQSSATTGEEYSRKNPPQTALISRQQLLSNLSATAPIIRLPAPSVPHSSVGGTAGNFATTVSSSGISLLPPISGSSLTTAGGVNYATLKSSLSSMTMPILTPNAKANVIFQAADKTVATNLRPDDIKALFGGGIVRFVVPGEGGKNFPVNIVLKQHQPLSTTTADGSQFSTLPGSGVSLKQVGTISMSGGSGASFTPISSQSPSSSSSVLSTSPFSAASSLSMAGLAGLTFNTASGAFVTTASRTSSTPMTAMGGIKIESSQGNPSELNSKKINTPTMTASGSIATTTSQFGQIYRSPITSSSGTSGSPKIPVSVLMPKTYVPATTSNETVGEVGTIQVASPATSVVTVESYRSPPTSASAFSSSVELKQSDATKSVPSQVDQPKPISIVGTEAIAVKSYPIQVGKPIQITSDTTAVPCSSPVTKQTTYIPPTSTPKKIESNVKLELKGIDALPGIASSATDASAQKTVADQSLVSGTKDLSITLKASPSDVDTSTSSFSEGGNLDSVSVVNPKPAKELPKSNKKNVGKVKVAKQLHSTPEDSKDSTVLLAGKTEDSNPVKGKKKETKAKAGKKQPQQVKEEQEDKLTDTNLLPNPEPSSTPSKKAKKRAATPLKSDTQKPKKIPKKKDSESTSSSSDGPTPLPRSKSEEPKEKVVTKKKEKVDESATEVDTPNKPDKPKKKKLLKKNIEKCGTSSDAETVSAQPQSNEPKNIKAPKTPKKKEARLPPEAGSSKPAEISEEPVFAKKSKPKDPSKEILPEALPTVNAPESKTPTKLEGKKKGEKRTSTEPMGGNSNSCEKKDKKYILEDQPAVLTASSATETPKKRDKKKHKSGDSSDGNSDDPVTPRLTRSMRRQSTNSGGS
jgi:hypothetical protein